ncbi:MAG: B12-binding domain-containing radical SAM protein [Candidatus Coatesbacteria bacterium]|nr:B12-binding domain-containing radical SAM protein [Candidatus Coatesbacteria bacterium]
MKIFLVIPPWNVPIMAQKKPSIFRNLSIYKGLPTHGCYNHIGFLYIASYLDRDGHKIKYIDGLIEGEKGIYDSIKKEKPDLVGFTVVTSLWDKVKELSENIKRINPSCKIVVGGIHATLKYKECLEECRYIDYVVIGEGELASKAIANAIQQNASIENIKGIAYKDGDEIRINLPGEIIQNLDELPFPDRDLVPMKKYISHLALFKNRHAAHVFTSRSCPYECSFCNMGSLLNKLRVRSPENILEEIKLIFSKYPYIKDVSFMDEFNIFSVKHDDGRRLAEMFMKQLPRFHWSLIHPNFSWDIELMKLYRKAGLWRIYLPIDSGVQRVRDYTHTPPKSVDEIREFTHRLHEAGIESAARFTFGHPVESEEDIEATIEFAKQCRIKYVNFLPALIAPYSRHFNYLNEKRLINEDMKTWNIYNSDYYESHPVSRKRVDFFRRKATKEYYLRLSYFKDYLCWSLKSWKNFTEPLRYIMRMIGE